MQKDYQVQHEMMRKELWCKAWCDVAGSSNCDSEQTCTKWADAALKDFDSRFPVPVETKAEVKVDSKTFYEKTGFKMPPNFTEDKIG